MPIPRWQGLRRVWRHFSPQVRRNRLSLLGAFLCLLATTLCQLAQPWPMKLLFDGILIPGKKSIPGWAQGLAQRDPGAFVLWSCVALLGISLLQAAVAFVAEIAGANAGHRIAAAIRKDLYLHLQRLSLAFHQKSRTGDLLLRLTGDIQLLKSLLVDLMLESAGAVVTFLGMTALMMWMDWRLGLAGLAFLPLVTLTTLRMSAQLKEVVQRSRRKEGELAGSLGESLAGVAMIQAYGGEATEAERFARQNRTTLRAGLKAARLEAALGRTVDLLIAASTAAVLWLGTRRVLESRLSPGDLLVFVAYLRSAYKPVRSLGKLATRVAKTQASAERILEVLEAEPDVRDLPGARRAPRFRGEVRFDLVTFGYRENEPVLRELDAVLEPGTLTALVGASGAGKSSAASLVPRFYDPQSGAVRLDGVNVREFTLDSLRSQITFVLQETILLGLSVGENVAYGVPDATPEQIWNALRTADADGFVGRLPQGLETVLGERGARISGGERQRLALARAAMRRTPILILDEPATSLDAESARLVEEAQGRLIEGTTTLVIAHNLAVVRRAQVVLFLEGGRIVERGTHDELVRRDGRYARFYSLQRAALTGAATSSEA